MGETNYTLSIPQPCTQSWQQMTPDSTGRFCTHCSQTIIDFTTLSDEEIIEVLKSRRGEMCGRFETRQLNRDLSAKQLIQLRSNRFRKVLAGVLLLLGIRAVSATSPPVVKAAMVQQRFVASEGINEGKDTSALSVLTGMVMDSVNNESIPFVKIYNVTRKINITSDFDGHFSINASIGDTVQLMYVGYVTYQFVVNSYENKTYVLKSSVISNFTPDYYISNDVLLTMGKVEKQLSKKEKLKLKIRRFFHIHIKK